MKAAIMILIAGLIAAPGALVLAQSSHDAHSSTAATPATHKATGVVKSVDRVKGSVMLAHDPVKSLNWPAMTMPFLVKDKQLFDKLQPGNKVEFEFTQQGKDYVVTSVK